MHGPAEVGPTYDGCSEIDVRPIVSSSNRLFRGYRVVVTIVLLFVSGEWADAQTRGTPADQSPSDVAWTWLEELYDVVKTEKTTPPPASRIYVITSIALYESIAGGTSKNRSLAGQLNGLNTVPDRNLYSRAITLSPDFAQAHTNLASLLHRTGQLDDAQTEYQEALRLEHRFAEAHYGMGTLWEQRGRLPDALQAYNRAIDVKKDFRWAQARVARLTRQQ